jgi:uncharacterized membrane protein YphA (DoxX/SURF4 family)
MVVTRDLQFGVDDRPGRVGVVGVWCARIALIAAFVVIGATKFDGDPHGQWVRVFARIGLGQWFRVFTGCVQIAGALLMLARRTLTLGAFLLGCTMVGAAIADATVMDAVGVAIVPLALFGAIAAIWFAGTYGATSGR